ncbi:MAG: PilZ domain-containing protein [Terriglobales bacterium]
MASLHNASARSAGAATHIQEVDPWLVNERQQERRVVCAAEEIALRRRDSGLRSDGAGAFGFAIPFPRCLREDKSMRRRLLQFLLSRCHHKFAWPRKTPDGEYYQVCLRCGQEYQYDWPRMRRIGKREKHNGQAKPSEDGSRRPAWNSRTRRLKTGIRAQFRSHSETNLRRGTVENISQSGLFIQCELAVQPSRGELLELIFEMPAEISGRQNALVRCVGQVVRISPQLKNEVAAGFAVSVIDYRFDAH